MSKKSGVVFSKPSEPAFLTAFKKKVGYKEGPNVDTKREQLGLDADQPDQEDELPTVVVLKEGDLSQEEAERALAEGARRDDDDDDDDEPPADSRIKFRKPKKRKSDDAEPEQTKSKKLSSGKKVKNSALLSFNDEDEDDG